MAKFIIETDEEMEHRNFLNGPAALSAIHSLGEEFRSKWKYSEKPPVSWEEVRNMFYHHCGEVMKEYD